MQTLARRVAYLVTDRSSCKERPVSTASPSVAGGFPFFSGFWDWVCLGGDKSLASSLFAWSPRVRPPALFRRNFLVSPRLGMVTLVSGCPCFGSRCVPHMRTRLATERLNAVWQAVCCGSCKLAAGACMLSAKGLVGVCTSLLGPISFIAPQVQVPSQPLTGGVSLARTSSASRSVQLRKLRNLGCLRVQSALVSHQ